MKAIVNFVTVEIVFKKQGGVHMTDYFWVFLQSRYVSATQENNILNLYKLGINWVLLITEVDVK